MKYYVRVGDKNEGPLELADLERRGLSADEYVWRDGMSDWQLAGDLPEVAAALHRKSLERQTLNKSDSPYQSPSLGSDYGHNMDYGPAAGPMRHSGLGIASLVIFGVSVLVFVAALGVVMVMMSDGPDPQVQQHPAFMMASVSMCCGTPVLNIVGLLVGVVGLFQPHRLKLFGVLGSVLNGIVVFGVAALFLFGMILGASMQ